MKRTQEEIVAHVEGVKRNDNFGFRTSDLVGFLTFENARSFLLDEFVEKVEAGEADWKVETEAHQTIIDYLDFAYKKVEDKESLLVHRSLEHLKAWIWIDDPDFYKAIIEEMENLSDQFGLEVLKKISIHYGHVQKPYEG